MSRTLVIAALALTGIIQGSALAAAQQVEFHLNSGQVVKGELVEQTDSLVRVKSAIATKSGSMSVTMAYKREDIASLVTLDDPEVIYAKRAKTAASADDHAALADWCREQALTDHAVDQARLALAQNPGQPAAKALLTSLGWILADGAWVKESDWLGRQGKVRYQGQVMTSAEADALKTKAKEGQVLADAGKEVDAKTAYIAALDKQLADLQKRPAQLDAAQAKATSALAAAQALVQRVAATETAYESAQRNLTSAQTANQRQPGAAGNTYIPPTNLAPYFQAVEDAKAAYNQARQDAGSADSEVARQQADLASLGDERKSLERKKADVTARRVRAFKELGEAQAALAKLPTASPGAAAKPDHAAAP